MRFAPFAVANWRKIPRLACALVLGLVALFAALPAGPAFANPPTMQTIHNDSTRVVPYFSRLCGFTVVRHRDLTIRIHIFTDQDGNVVREIDNFQDNGYLAANGLIVNYHGAGPNLVTFYPDGSILFAGTGLFYNFPGTGDHFAGRASELDDADGNVISESFSGIDEGSFADVCAALTP